jgi:hypothetical protein
MKRPLALLLGAMVAIALAACGGGGGGVAPLEPQPQPTVTNPPPVTYAVTYTWQGAMNKSNTTAQSSARRAMGSSIATPEPVQIPANPCLQATWIAPATPPPNACGNNYFQGSYGTIPGGSVVNIVAQVSPAPVPSVVPTWQPVPATAPLITPSPNPGATPGVLTVIAAPSPGAFTLNGTVPIPGAPQTVSPQGYVFPTVALGRDATTFMGTVSAIYFSNGRAIATTDTSQSDVFITWDGSTAALNIPGGFTLFSLNNESFMDITTSQWSAGATTMTFPAMMAMLSDATTATPLGEMQTRSGHYVRFLLTAAASGGALLLTYDCSGASITGSY